MRKFSTPIVVISRCLEFDHVRYNGGIVKSDFVRTIKDHVHCIPVCPEVEIGLGIPRDPVRIVRSDNQDRLMQPATGNDYTEEMVEFSRQFLHALPAVDGFILKSKSPTSGYRDVPIYPSLGRSAPIDKGAGFFARVILELFSGLPIEDEGRIRNHRIRDHFLTFLYCITEFREVKETHDIRQLLEFHSRNKILLMVHDQKITDELGRLLAQHTQEPFEAVASRYDMLLRAAFKRPAQYTSNINALLHTLGHFSKRLNHEEKALFLDAIEQYRNGRTSIAPAKMILREWIARFGDDYLFNQTFFSPYPEALFDTEVSETDRGRDFWD
jgi:uncharacterized protein YbgA (DUF1722 family)/uncharacterized protein YbbK (DUF523 family)